MNEDDAQTTLLVLSARPENVRLLEDLLGSKYRVRTATTCDPARDHFDVCLVDSFTIERYAEVFAARKAQSPDVFLPTLGLVSPGEASEVLIESFDEVIRIPCTKAELVHRVDLLVRARRLSLANRELLERLRNRVSGLEVEIEGQRESERALTRKKTEAESANQTKSAFLANMSHEIRTPLGVILGFTALLRDGSLPSDQRLHYIDTIERNGQSLTRIIDDILDLAKVEAGKIVIERVPFSLAQLVNECLGMFSDKASQKGIYLLLNIEGDVPEAVLSDPTRIRQVLINLIGNAVKFTSVGGVRITLSRAPDDAAGPKYRVSVRDTGIGLTLDQQQILFRAFVQADESTTRKFGGTGLGLVLSRRLAEALGGEISIDRSPPGPGCTFVFTFHAPIADPAPVPRTPGPTHSPRSYLSGRRVLAVDDSEDNLFLIKHMLGRAGAVAEIAVGGQEALEHCARAHYDVILLDIQMPGLDGYETIHRLRRAGVTEPIVALTAHAMDEERARTAAAGFDAHVTKPISSDRLREALMAVLSPRP